jgi:hypothetical protein
VPPVWTTEQVLSLAPDASSAKAGTKQSSPAAWSGLGAGDTALWGLCQGSGSKPYQAVVDLSEPAFKCSCPSRKFPCKHALGLMLLYAQDATRLGGGTPPEWAQSWLDSRAQRAEKAGAPAAPKDPEKAAGTAARTAAKREQRVSDGIDELRLWLDDLIRQGLAHAEQRGHAEWGRMAARLVDAQAPGLARKVGDAGALLGAGEHWPAWLLDELAMLSLLIDAYPRHAELPEGLRADIRSLVGWSVTAEELAQSGERADATWRCVGQALETDDRLRVRRTWLWAATERRYALLLDFAHPSQPLPPAPAPAQTVRAELAYFAAAAPLRARILAQHPGAAADGPHPDGGTVGDAYRQVAGTLGQNPWSERHPVSVTGVPVQRGGRWLLADHDLDALRLKGGHARLLDLAAFAGGRPVGVFGEWTGQILTPLSAWRDGETISL